MAGNVEIVHAYRHLYRGILRAVQYAAPARYVARDQLRAAFRGRVAAWDPEGAKRTRWFFEAAEKERGLEHKILKNLLQSRRARSTGQKTFKQLHQESQKKAQPVDDEATASRHYNMTIAMLNKSMGLCLR